MPSGFSIDSFEPARLEAHGGQATGSGEEKRIEQVTWSGGKRADGRGRRLPVQRQHELEQELHVQGPADVLERQDRRLDGLRELGHAGTHVEASPTLGGGSSSTLTIVALIVGAVGVVLGILGLATRGRPLT